MDQFDTITYEQACDLLRRHADRDVALITAPFPGMSFQISGTLFVQNAQPFAFAVMADERLSISVVPFPDCVFQTPQTAAPTPDAVICAMPGEEPGSEIMMWMLRFA